MPPMNALTDTAVRNAKPRDKVFKLADGGGMYLAVSPSGGKWWRFKYRVDGKEKLLALGTYPDVGLARAREKRDAARKLLADGIDPGAARKAAKAEKTAAADRAVNTFEAVAREWHGKQSISWAPSNAARILRRLEVDVFPIVGALPVGEVTAPALLAMIRRIEARGVLETAHRALGYSGQVMRYAVATGRADRDPSGDLQGALPPCKVTHHASITDPKAIGSLLRVVEGYEGAFTTKCALRLAPLLFVRPGELRGAEWVEVDLDTAEWRIPKGRMKMKAPHLVPLARQALAVLRELQTLTGSGKYFFPSIRSGDRCMSENTINAALRRMGYTGNEMTGHGFRSMASTLLNEQGWNRDAIERQLAHAERDNVRAAYNYAEHLPERRKMMQAWADYLDRLREGAEVLASQRRTAGT
ncbi:MAG: integrase arm-type DNA-binding domain-containing protein [Deltaproteobacteria bacterium]|nr:integrase arm-type DNA-binding domain-containing protein [Deltaproteobacteria bacterium]